MTFAELLLLAGVKADTASLTGLTAMHLAAVDGSETIIKMLLDVGANTNVQNYLGWTPLHCAISMDQLDLLPILLKGGGETRYRGQGRAPSIRIHHQ